MINKSVLSIKNEVGKIVYDFSTKLKGDNFDESYKLMCCYFLESFEDLDKFRDLLCLRREDFVGKCYEIFRYLPKIEFVKNCDADTIRSVIDRLKSKIAAMKKAHSKNVDKVEMLKSVEFLLDNEIRMMETVV